MSQIELSENMTRAEKRATSGLAAIFGLRMLGMFLILPVFALYAGHLPGGDNHTLVGLTLGMYGLTQAALMIPFGMASDHIGRKKSSSSDCWYSPPAVSLRPLRPISTGP